MILLGIFLLAALIQLFLPSSTREISRNVASALIDLKAGLHYVFNHRNLRLIAGLFFINGIAIGLTQPLDVFVTLERLELPKESVQWFSASEGVGMLLGGILAAMCMSLVERHRQRVITGTLVVWSILTIIEVLSVWPLLTASARILSGIATAFFQVIFSALLIKEVNPDYIGRANGVIVPLMMAGILIGTATSGLFLALSSLFVVYSISALLTLLSCVLALKMTSDSKRAHH
jgi:predicted MFS family arabinose efflux permease